jgi:lysophospholipase L1-like esterase
MAHTVLLGDSIFDNAPYVAGGPAVIDHLQQQLPEGWRGTLLAVDGSITSDVPYQLRRLPSDASHLFVSIGGNDALSQAGVLEKGARSVAEGLLHLAEVSTQFEQSYQRMLQAVLQQRCPTALCTIYYPAYPDPLMQRVAVTASSLFNDCILRAAIGAGLPVLDLRLVCNDPADYANPIEPSVAGGAKIARGIVEVITQHNFSAGRTTIYH